jgi:hypothetical protein
MTVQKQLLGDYERIAVSAKLCEERHTIRNTLRPAKQVFLGVSVLGMDDRPLGTPAV